MITAVILFIYVDIDNFNRYREAAVACFVNRPGDITPNVLLNNT